MDPLYRLYSTLTLLIAVLVLPAVAWAQPATPVIIDLTAENASGDHNGARFIQEDASEGAGTGILDPFARTKSNADFQQMMNTDGVPQFQTESGPWTTSLLLSTITDRDLGADGIFKEFILDINQTSPHRIYPMNDVHIWEDDDPDLNCYNPDEEASGASPIGGGQWTCADGADATPIFWLDRDLGGSFPGTTGNATVVMDYSLESGSGNQTDIVMLIPLASFGDAENCSYGSSTCSTYVYVFSEFGDILNGECNEDGAIFTKTVGNKSYECSGNDDGFEEWSTLVEPFINITKFLEGSVDETHDWEITKDVDSNECDQFIGGSCTFNYDINVTEIENFSATIGGYVDYAVPPTLPDGDEVAPDANVTVGPDIYSDGDGVVTWDDPVNCGQGATFTVGAGETVRCNYTIVYGDPADADTGLQSNEITATVEFSESTFYGYIEATIASNLDGPPEVLLTDSYANDYGLITGDTFWEYQRVIPCSTDEADYNESGVSTEIYPNTAELLDGETVIDDDSENVTVRCYIPLVSKTGAGTYDQNYDWEITKDVDPAVHNLFIGEDADSDYDVDVDLTYYENDFKISGTITVVNPHPSASMDVTVVDVLNDGSSVIIDCGAGDGDNTLTVAAASPGECDYRATPETRTASLNTVTATYDVYPFEATADIVFTVEDVNGEPEINVEDSIEGALGSATDDDSFPYTNNFECPTDVELYVNGQYSYDVDNTATIVETGDNDSETVTVNCFAPVVTKTANGSFATTITWTIDKTATPTQVDLFTGESHEVDYVITLDKTVEEAGYSVVGNINVVNYHPSAVMNVTVADALNDGTDAILACGGNLAVPSGGGAGADCGYTAAPSDDSATLNTATVTLNAIPFEATAAVSFSTDPDGYDEINVTDDNAGLAALSEYGPFSDDDTIEYTRTFECNENEGQWTNTATIVETTDSDDATVTVNCYDLEVTKNANPSFTRTYDWTVDKSVDPESWDLFDGESGTSLYTIVVTKDGGTDSDHAVTGSITVVNNHPTRDAELFDDVSDSIEGVGSVSVDCGGATSVPADGQIDCTYSSDLPNGATRVNTATATQQLYDFDSAGVPSADGTKDYTGMADIDFTGIEPTLVNDEADLTDSYADAENLPANPISAGGSWSYERTWVCGTDNGEGTWDNTATLTLADEGGPYTNDATVTVACYDIEVTKDADERLTQNYDWEIDKVADPASWAIFAGDQATSNYSIVATRTLGELSDYEVDGNIYVVNNHESANADIVDLTDDLSGFGELTITNCEIVDAGPVAGPPYSIGPGQTLHCEYSGSLPNGEPRTNTATATLQLYAYDYENPTVPSGTDDYTGDASVDFAGVTPEVGQDDTATADDSAIEDDWGFGPESPDCEVVGDDLVCEVTYSRTFGPYAAGDECGPGIEIDNTVVITGDDSGDELDDSSATVTIDCYELEVTKDSDETFTREWDWQVVKTAEAAFGGDDPNAGLLLDIGQTFTVQYNVEVSVTSSEDRDHAASGSITIHNPATIGAELAGVADVITAGGIDGGADCGVTFPHTIAAGGNLVCSWAADLPNADDRTNTATASLNNYAYPVEPEEAPIGTTDFSGTADIAFGDPTLLVDECTDVTDPHNPGGASLGQVCVDDVEGADFYAPHTFHYLFDIGPITSDDCGEWTVDNTATQDEIDTDDMSTSTVTIDVEVNCPTGCTLTQGYWKTHNPSFKGGASKKADPTWYLGLGDWDEDGDVEGELESFFGNGTWFEVFWTSPKGNAYYNLAHQWMAATLNCVNVDPEQTPDCSVIEDAWEGALDFFQNNDPDDVGKGKNKNKALAQQLIDWAGTLGAFNEGLIGPGHCSDDGSSGDARIAGTVEAALELEAQDGVTEASVNSEVQGDDKATANLAVSEKDVDAKAATAQDDTDRVMNEDEPYQAAVKETEVAEVKEIEIEAAPVEIPNDFAIGNYPNPFNPTTTIQVAIPEASHVRVAVYDLLGRMVTMLVDGQLSAGTHSVTFDAGSLPSGVYLYRMEYSGGAITKTMQLMK